MGDFAVLADNLAKSFGATRAVDGISFRVEPGECFGFLGVNGAGKTTTVRMIQCVSPPSAGRLAVLGSDVTEDPAGIKARIGVVPQDSNLDPDLTVRNNLLVYARYFGITGRRARERADELLRFVELAGRARSRVPELSGGMKRRLILARSMINRPELVVLDEPTTGLDPQARHLVWSRLRSLRATGVSMLLTTHYLEEAAQLCNRVAIMDAGTLLAVGDPDTLVREHVGTECIEIRPHAESLAAARERLDALPGTWEETGDTLFYYPHDGAGIGTFADLPHERLVHRPATLEDLFLRLTGRELQE